MEDTRYKPYEGAPHIIPLVMFIPSTILFIFLCYIILKKSPEGMKKYKYVIFFVSFSAYQFDVITTVVLPTSLPKMLGLQASGILGAMFPDSGCYLQILWLSGMNVIGLAITFSFIWREYSLIPFEKYPLGICLHCLHFVITFFVYYFKYKYNVDTCTDARACRHYLDQIDSWYSPSGAVYCIMPSVKPAMMKYQLFMALGIIIICCNVLKAVIRIKRFTKFHSRIISRTTLRQHKMLLRSLIIQLTCPVFLFIIPITIIGLFTYFELLYPLILPNLTEDQQVHISVVVVSTFFFIPSFYSMFHVITVIYFTTPYRNYVAELLGFRRQKIIERQ